MRISSLAVIAGAGLLLTGAAHASQELAQKSGCMTCHVVSGTKTVGPTFKDVADKYKADKGAEAKLVKKVKEGGKGAWGEIPMPPNASVKDDDIKTLVKWILATK